MDPIQRFSSTMFLQSDTKPSISGKDMSSTLSSNRQNSVISEQDILEMFGRNRERLNYYLALKEAKKVSNRLGEELDCDPRDLLMRKKLEMTRWKPTVVLKLPDESDYAGCEVVSKQTALDKGYDGESPTDSDSSCGEEDKKKSHRRMFCCDVTGCKLKFSSLASYESHYHMAHEFVCTQCSHKPSFASNFLLDIHLEENHDPFFKIKSQTTNMYRCLVQTCEQKFQLPWHREDHLATVHNIKKFYFHRPLQRKKLKKPKGGQFGQFGQSSQHPDNRRTENTDRYSSQQSSTSMECDYNREPRPGTSGTMFGRPNSGNHRTNRHFGRSSQGKERLGRYSNTNNNRQDSADALLTQPTSSVTCMETECAADPILVTVTVSEENILEDSRRHRKKKNQKTLRATLLKYEEECTIDRMDVLTPFNEEMLVRTQTSCGTDGATPESYTLNGVGTDDKEPEIVCTEEGSERALTKVGQRCNVDDRQDVGEMHVNRRVHIEDVDLRDLADTLEIVKEEGQSAIVTSRHGIDQK